MSEADTFYLAATSSDVFWMDNDNIVRHQIGIGETILATDPFFPEFIMLYSQDVYWTSLDGTLRRVPQSGNGPSVIVYHTDDIWGPRATARNDTSIFWVNGAPHGWLRSMSGDGGTVTALAETQNSYHGIAVDETHVYWTSRSLGEVYSMPVSGGPVTILASDQGRPTRILLDGEYVYWINDGGGQLHTVGGRVMKMHKAGGAPITLAIVSGVSDDGTDPSVTEESLGDIAVDDTSVYWTVDEDTVGRVMKVAK